MEGTAQGQTEGSTQGMDMIGTGQVRPCRDLRTCMSMEAVEYQHNSEM